MNEECVGERRLRPGFWWVNLKERDNLEDVCLDGRIILKWIFYRWGLRARIVSIWFRAGTNGELLRLW
jgi:hypothetical protein